VLVAFSQAPALSKFQSDVKPSNIGFAVFVLVNTVTWSPKLAESQNIGELRNTPTSHSPDGERCSRFVNGAVIFHGDCGQKVGDRSFLM